jgi:hypothetical protein
MPPDAGGPGQLKIEEEAARACVRHLARAGERER